MANKRVVAFFDMFDEIPEKATYLFSRKVEVPAAETEEDKTKRIISDNPESLMPTPYVLYIHYYEVDDMDFEDLMSTELIKDTYANKIKAFLSKYKIQSK